MATRPLTAQELEAVKRRPKLTSMERRLLRTLECAISQLAAVKPVEKDPEAQRTAYDPREKILVVVQWDGFTEVYAEEYVDVKVVECWPWEDPEELMMPAVYNGLYYPGKLRGTALAKMCKSPGLPEIALKFADHLNHVELIETIREKIEQLRTP